MAKTIFASQDAWRRHPMLSGGAKGLKPFPGILTAAGIFAAYLVLDIGWKQMTYSPNTGAVYKYIKEDVGEVPELKGGH
ncbi:hypothetical protein CTAYLR_002711 [Chrysophaeum taylorii]|uniref:Uncharacterized protein n=1 Tax=Chrysophaeum taylorii TaxID=2483200 RepID=A0AAD7UBR4_9STRA|nr:hypothetical protein CTAYLR_002711 [Chrysophaeum taylorii]